MRQDFDAKLDGKGYVEAIVWTRPGMDFIVGLPDIAKSFVDLLTSMLTSALEIV